MAAVPTKPEGAPWLLPMLAVVDGAKSLEFYERAFGFTAGDVMKDDSGQVLHAAVSYRDATVMLAPGHPSWTEGTAPALSGVAPPGLLYVYVDDVDTFFAHASAAGAGVKAAPADYPWGDRMCTLTDLDGHVWNFATHIGFGPVAA